MGTGQIAGAEQKRANYLATCEEKSFLEQLLPLLGRERMMPVQPVSKRPMSAPDRHQLARFPVSGAPEARYPLGPESHTLCRDSICD